MKYIKLYLFDFCFQSDVCAQNPNIHMYYMRTYIYMTSIYDKCNSKDVILQKYPKANYLLPNLLSKSAIKSHSSNNNMNQMKLYFRIYL